MKRIMLPNMGPDMDKIPTAFALGVKECQRVESDVLTIVTPQKNLDSIVVGEYLGKAASKTLMKGQQFPVSQVGLLFEYESVATAVKKASAKVGVAFYVSADNLIKLDALPFESLIYVPWCENEGTAWAAKWNAETFGMQTNDGAIDLPQDVLVSLENLTRCVNLSTGLAHPSDKENAKGVFSRLKKDRVRWNPNEIEKWAARNGWKPKDAQELAALSAKYL